MAKVKVPSGKFILRMDTLTHAHLRLEAERMNVSLNKVCLSKLTQREPTALHYGFAKLVEHFGSGALGLALFGSWAREENTASSDRDLLIAVDGSINIDRSLYRMWDEKLSISFGRNDSPHFVHLPQPAGDIGSLWLECSLEGIVLGESNRALTNVFQMIRHRIASGQYVRKISHGHPYWVAKESA